jgi:hypothetical protein
MQKPTPQNVQKLFKSKKQKKLKQLTSFISEATFEKLNVFAIKYGMGGI